MTPLLISNVHRTIIGTISAANDEAQHPKSTQTTCLAEETFAAGRNFRHSVPKFEGLIARKTIIRLPDGLTVGHGFDFYSKQQRTKARA